MKNKKIIKAILLMAVICIISGIGITRFIMIKSQEKQWAEIDRKLASGEIRIVPDKGSNTVVNKNGNITSIEIFGDFKNDTNYFVQLTKDNDLITESIVAVKNDTVTIKTEDNLHGEYSLDVFEYKGVADNSTEMILDSVMENIPVKID